MEFRTREIAFLLALGILISSLGLCNYIKGKSLPAKLDSSEQPGLIIVHVAGCVRNPGVYRLPAESRVVDAVAAAGGALPDADLHRLNLAAYVRDGDKINVPGKILPSGESTENRLININTADQKTLETLPNIGPAKARNIVQYRETHGYFNAIEDILKVNLIGPKTFEGIRDLITVGE